MSSESIPVISFDDLVSEDVGASARVASAIVEGFGRFGLVYVQGAPVASADLDELYDSFLGILARSPEEKSSWGGPQIFFQRGYTPPNTEQAVIAGGQPDFKECFFAAPMAVDPLCVRWFPEVYADNVWPDDAARFRELTLLLGRQLHGLGRGLLRACERALDVPSGSLVSKAEGGAHLSRLLKYLPLSEDQVGTGVLWGEEHTDFNLLTLLPGGRFFRDGVRRPGPAAAGGLYLRSPPTEAEPNGRVVPGTAPPGCVVAQVGQQLEVLSGGRFLATPHGIVPPDEPGWVRTSLAHFVHLNARERVEPLPEYRAMAGDAYAPPVLAGTWALKTLVDIGLAPPEVLGRLGYRHYNRLAQIREARARVTVAKSAGGTAGAAKLIRLGELSGALQRLWADLAALDDDPDETPTRAGGWWRRLRTWWSGRPPRAPTSEATLERRVEAAHRLVLRVDQLARVLQAEVEQGPEPGGDPLLAELHAQETALARRLEASQRQLAEEAASALASWTSSLQRAAGQARRADLAALLERDRDVFAQRVRRVRRHLDEGAILLDAELDRLAGEVDLLAPADPEGHDAEAEVSAFLRDRTVAHAVARARDAARRSGL